MHRNYIFFSNKSQFAIDSHSSMLSSITFWSCSRYTFPNNRGEVLWTPHDLTTNLHRTCQERAKNATVEIWILFVCPEWAPTRQECATTPPRWRRLLPRLTPESSACIFLPSVPSEPRLSADLPDSATNHPERALVSPDSATEEPRIMPNQLESEPRQL